MTDTVRVRGTVTGTGRLLRFMLRRDRVRLPTWILSIALSIWAIARSFPNLYPDEASRQARAQLMQSPAAVALGGPKIGIDDYTFGAMMTNEMLGLSAVIVALMGIFTIVRHTRADEESGRLDLMLAAPVGRHAPLAAAFSLTALANVALFVLTAVLLGSLGLDGMSWPGSWLFAAALVSAGFVFAGVAGVAAQVTTHARTASSLAGLMLGIAYGVRAVGDVADSDLSWLSPIAWAQRTYAYVDDRWWPLAISAAVTVVLVALTAVLASHRDIGAGLLTARPGPRRAGRTLTGSFGLAFRLERVSLVAWTLSLLVFGLVYGTLLSEVADFAGTSSTVEDVLAGYSGAVLDAFMSLLVVLLSMTASIFGVMAVLRAKSEETSGRAEPVLAAPVSRTRWFLGHSAVSAFGGVLVLLAGVLGVGVSGSIAIGEPEVLGKMLEGGLVQIAPLLAVVAFTMAVYGWLPRLTGLAWALLGSAFFLNTFGGLLQLPDWMLDLSPYTLVPLLPGEAWSPWPVVWMGVAAAAMAALGLVGLRRRDLLQG